MGAGPIAIENLRSDSQTLQGNNQSNSACPVCSAPHSRYLFRKKGYRIYQCPECNLEFLSPQPDDKVLASIYTSEYFLGDRDEQSQLRVAQLKSATAFLYLNQLQEVMTHSGGRILEVGCGTGDFLLQARDRGFHVQGIEYSSAAAETANQRLGARVVETGTLDSVRLPTEYFNAMVACDVIEHVRDPKAFLQMGWKWLKPGGVLFLATPSVDSWSRKLMGKKWM